MGLTGKHIVLGMGGGIAAYKAIEVVRELQRRQAEVRVVMTASATRFVGAVTLAGLTGQAPVIDLWDPRYPGEVHVELTDWADAIVVAPATQNLMARLCAGLADDALLATLACSSRPLLLAPAMHERMWCSPANRRNVAQLQRDGVHFAGPERGPLANGSEGLGRMAEPVAIVDVLATLFARSADLRGRRVLVSAGPTQEDLDPVRYISNRSSGRMGFAIAEAALSRGAHVIVVAGPTDLAPPAGVELIRVRSAREMQAAIEAVDDLDAVVMTAAVADYRPATLAESKLKKSGDQMTIELVKNPDILAGLGQRRQGKLPVLVGFAMETDDVVGYARKKLVDKGVDLVVGNEAKVGFGGDENEVVLVSHTGDEPLPRMRKLDLGHRIWDRVLALLG